jgi:hypothetical protein
MAQTLSVTRRSNARSPHRSSSARQRLTLEEHCKCVSSPPRQHRQVPRLDAAHFIRAGFPPSAFSKALAADATDLKVSAFDLSPSSDFIGQPNSIYVVALEIPHQAALQADEVMMDVGVPVEAQAIGGHLYARDQPLVFQAV